MQQLRILTIGAGIAGLTCAALFKKQGLDVKVIEKVPRESFNATGYMLGLLPLGGRVMNQLDAREQYFDRSVEMKNYEIHKENGELNKAFSLDFINHGYGSYRGIEREALIDILLEHLDADQVQFGITTKEINQANDEVEVTFSDGSSEKFDVVIAADGIHSETRKMLFSENEYSYYDTHWGGWVAWLENQHLDRYKEYWGASSFMGLYPVKDKIGIFLGGPNHLIEQQGIEDFTEHVQKEILPEYQVLHDALHTLKTQEKPYYWEFHDSRADHWNKGNVILLGDAACGFLPTAGVGASMAMDSAAALVDELSRTAKGHIDYGMYLFIKRQKHRVETAQKDSRNLGKIMFVKSGMMAGLRDYAVRFYSLKQLASGISKTMEGEG